MSRKYKFLNKEGIYFVSFATVYWIDVFIREIYFHEVIESLKHCQKEKRMEIFAYCIMTNHMHLIFRAKENNPGDIIKSFKQFTSNKLQSVISENGKESRRNWLLWIMEKAAIKNSNAKKRQFWQQHNHPIELCRPEVMDQKLEYTHNNPVKAGFVREPQDWKYSSAIDYCGGKGLLDISFI
jgi:REP element-mobilizing transposase RayT